MIMLSAEELARWSRGTWVPEPPREIKGVSHDTRTLKPGMLYVALSGERFDGHQFIAKAFSKGACGAMIQRDNPYLTEDLRGPLLVVDDPFAALQAMAAAYRRQLDAHIVGVTGSAGKTTVKDMIATLLGTAMPTARTQGNWNNAIGLPLSILGMSRADQAGVFEVGMNHPGELAPLCQILLPHWGVVTNVGPVHMEFFDSVQSIAMEKAELLRSLPEDGVAVLNRDSQFFDLLAASAPGKILTVSMKNEADYVCRDKELADDGMSLVIDERATAERHVIQLPLVGEHHILNAMLAIAVARDQGIEWPDIAHSLKRFIPAPMRWQKNTLNGVTFINDAYNANPMSMRAAVEAFQRVATRSRKWLVLGGMLELGRIERHEHHELGRFLGRYDWAGLVTVGELGVHIAAGAESAGFRRRAIHTCIDSEEAVEKLITMLRPGDQVLLKASRGMRLEEVIDGYREQGSVVDEPVAAALA